MLQDEVGGDQSVFREFLRPLDPVKPIAVLCHSDADGVSAGAILIRALRRAGYNVVAEVTGKGESAWSKEMAARLARHAPHALIVADLGSMGRAILEGVPTLLIDHHRPDGVPANAVLITGYSREPTPTSGLLAYRLAQGIGPAEEWLWIAAVSILGDLGDSAPFGELEAAKAKYKATPLKNATALVNAPRRTAAGDARAALDLLLKANGPRDVVRGDSPEAAALRAAKTEVSAAFAEAKKAGPKFSEPVALIRIDTPCQVHPLIAQIWRTRLPKHIVMAANVGYLPGRVNFSARCPKSINLLDFLREHAPSGAGDAYGHGHDQASGGSLPFDLWNQFVAGIGFGPESQV